MGYQMIVATESSCDLADEFLSGLQKGETASE
jgi:hypothetical protein